MAASRKRRRWPKTLAAIALIAAFAAGGWLLWRSEGRRLAASPEYQVQASDIELEPLPPAWIEGDLASEVFHSLRASGPLSLLDDRLTQDVAEAFAAHPWVAGVRRVEKSHPSRLRVVLEYRRPVCLVELPRGRVYVDRSGVVLPLQRLNQSELPEVPVLVGVDTPPLGAAGEPWGDPRVHGAAEIAAVLAAYVEPWAISRIIPSPVGSFGTIDRTEYSLLCEDGTRIIWGHAPQSEDPSQVDARMKIDRLRAFFGRSQEAGDARPDDVDVRRLPAVPAD